jgi:heat shock protein beta
MLSLIFAFTLSKKAKMPKAKTVEYQDDGTREKIYFNLSTLQQPTVENRMESHEYQAETTKLLSILIDSLYHNKDIFMREIISNANDAIDKVRFQTLRNPRYTEGGPKELEILIDINEAEKTISVTDTGIGMTKRELIENLGRIAKSGTQEFQRLLASGDTNLIGQFGVGFYSSFLVSEQVTVVS